MSVADRDAVYAQARRVIRPRGRLAVYDVVAESGEPLTFPVPWSTAPATSHLLTAAQTRAALEAAGFAITRSEDLTPTASGWLAGERRAGGGLSLPIVMGIGVLRLIATAAP